jgi:hypothetical protein
MFHGDVLANGQDVRSRPAGAAAANEGTAAAVVVCPELTDAEGVAAGMHPAAVTSTRRAPATVDTFRPNLSPRMGTSSSRLATPSDSARRPDALSEMPSHEP